MLRCADLADAAIRALFAPYRLRTERVPDGSPIPGSYWGEPEAGLVRRTLYYRGDTPVHSLLHEGAHYVCLSPARRAGLHTDAGGDDLEECAVCYLQVLLADALTGVERDRLLADMDAWGYSFRLGSAGAWFREDAADARQWLRREGLVDGHGRPRPVLRGAAS
ncbi:hypothetical protein [Lentisalinibacter sediminis]|uniref:hypothetical protein n=1 Tax=Lentisalinibacter sediminis TaxID=2992237 RepID=UPI0038647EAA